MAHPDQRERQDREEADGSVLADALCGALAGAAAVWVMDRIDWFNFDHEDAAARSRTQSVRPGGMDPAHAAAARIAETAGYALSPAEHHAAGLATHYAIGVIPGAIYGALRERVPVLAAGRGAAYGFGMFLAEDELLNPVAGLSAPPAAYPWQAHARGLVAHLVYGLVLDAAFTALQSLSTAKPHRHP